MSQALPPKPGEKDNPGEPIRSKDELLEFFRSGEKPRSQFKVGTEHEKFGFLVDTKEPLPFDGPRGIEAILNGIADDPVDTEAHGPWTRVEDDGRLVALLRGKASITLEPGGQLELSGAPLDSIHETCVEVGEHLKLLKRVCRPLGVGFIGTGFHPTARYDDFPVVPKQRYRVMERYMPKVGTRGLDMMKRTATVQANLDFESESDMSLSMRAALGISPLVTALFANSPFKDGRPSGALSERTLVWTDTDLARSGFVPAFLDEKFGYEAYLDWVLNVPMYFIRRDGKHLDYAGASFRTFMTTGIDGHRATMRDFEDHLTTAFPEVRLKRYLEVRSADCGAWSRICALPALWKGVLYDKDARAEALALMDNPSAAELEHLRLGAALHGFKARYRDRPVQELVESLLAIARAGLDRQAHHAGAPSEAGFLSSLDDAVARGQTFAERLLELYSGPWDEDLAHLWGEIEFFDDGK
jgi:glutamate--cysteine ligase